MQQRSLYVFIGIGIVLLGGVFLVWSKKTRQIPAQNQTPAEESVDTPKAELLDTSDWMTYRNEEFGIEFKYPMGISGWALKTEDCSRDSSLPCWPQRSVFVSHDSPRELEGYPNEELRFIFSSSRYGDEGAILPVDAENVYIFDFHGQRAVGFFG